jgi:cell division protein FtsX
LLASGIAYGLWRLAVSGHAATGAEAVGSAVGSLGASMVRALEIAWVPLLVFVLGAVGGLVTHYVRQRRRRRKRRRVSKRRDPSTV